VAWGLREGTRATLGASELTAAVFRNLAARARRPETIESTVSRTF